MKRGLEEVGVENERFEVVTNRVHVNILVNELDGLCTEGVPDELAGAAGGLDRNVNLREPAVVGVELYEHRVG